MEGCILLKLRNLVQCTYVLYCHCVSYAMAECLFYCHCVKLCNDTMCFCQCVILCNASMYFIVNALYYVIPQCILLSLRYIMQ